MEEYYRCDLICQGKTIKNIDKLKKYFSIEEVLHYYNKKQLHLWLTKKRYSYELWRISNILSNNPKEIAKELKHIFCISEKNNSSEKTKK